MTFHGKHHKRRPGVHRKHTSPATQRWNRDHLIPERPSWMDGDTYRKLARLRQEGPRARVNERFLRARDVAEMLDVRVETVLRWHRSGKLPGGHRLASNVLRFSESELEAWLYGAREAPGWGRGGCTRPRPSHPTRGVILRLHPFTTIEEVQTMPAEQRGSVYKTASKGFGIRWIDETGQRRRQAGFSSPSKALGRGSAMSSSSVCAAGSSTSR